MERWLTNQIEQHVSESESKTSGLDSAGIQ